MATRTTDAPVFPIPRTDPFGVAAEYGRLRDEQPVSRVRLEDVDEEVWLVTGFRQAREVLGSKRFSSDATRPGFPQPARFRRRNPNFGRTLIRMDPPEHTRQRRLLSPEFMIPRVEAMRP